MLHSSLDVNNKNPIAWAKWNGAEIKGALSEGDGRHLVRPAADDFKEEMRVEDQTTAPKTTTTVDLPGTLSPQSSTTALIEPLSISQKRKRDELTTKKKPPRPRRRRERESHILRGRRRDLI